MDTKTKQLFGGLALCLFPLAHIALYAYMAMYVMAHVVEGDLTPDWPLLYFVPPALGTMLALWSIGLILYARKELERMLFALIFTCGLSWITMGALYLIAPEEPFIRIMAPLVALAFLIAFDVQYGENGRERWAPLLCCPLYGYEAYLIIDRIIQKQAEAAM